MTSSLSVLLPGFEGPTLPAWVEHALHDGLAGVCLFGSNVTSPSQLRALTDAVHAANPHAVVAIDEEGGDVSRLHQADGSPFPGNAALGRLDDVATTEQVATRVGRQLRDAGVDLTFGPVVDVNVDPRNPVIGVRSFGTDAELVARHAAAWVRGVQSTGVAACAKHFPGHGDTAADSHLTLPTVHADLATLRCRELPPFAAAVAAGTATVMSSHLVVPALDPDRPATFSRPILRDLLRDELGFDGVVVSDALDMVGASGDVGVPAAAVGAVHGGCDLLCLGSRTTEQELAAVAAALDGATCQGRLDPRDLATAGRRVGSLGSSLARTREARPAATAAVPPLDPDRLVPVLDVSPAARDAVAAASRLAWVRLEAEPNIAVGVGPWGPFALGVPATVTLTPADDPAAAVAAVPADATVVVVGRDLGRHPVAARAVAAFRARQPTVVVEMGWPDHERTRVDVATHGASRPLARALLRALAVDATGQP